MKVLLIVDDWESLERYTERLEKNFDVLEAPFASEGIQAAKDLKPDRILIDLTFEDMSPAEAYEELSSYPTTRSIPKVIVLDKGQHTALENLEKAGELLKLVYRPYSFDELIKFLGA